LLARLRAQGKGIADWLPSPETPEAELWVVAEYEAVEAHDARRKAEIEIERRRVEEVWAEQNYAWCDAGDADTGGPPHLLSREQGTKPRGTSVCGVRPEGTSGWVPHRAPHYPGFYRTCCELCLRLGQGLSLYRNAS
jgi:hypothetical protein